MLERQTWQVDSTTRLDHWLLEMWPWLDRSSVRDLIRGGDIEVDGQRALKPGQYLESGTKVALVPPTAPERTALDSEESTLGLDTPLSVLYEDDGLIVIDKPAGLTIRSRRGSAGASLTALLSAQYPGMAHVGSVGQAGIVSLLDEGVSGPVLAAKDEATFRELKRLVARRRLEVTYTALLEGHLSGEGLIDAPLGHSKRVRERLEVAREGRTAQTAYRVQRHLRDHDQSYTLALLLPESNRMHQLRVHMAYYGCPIVGDRQYGSRRQTLLQDRIFLHLSLLRVPHPVTGDMLSVESRLPLELSAILQYLLRPRR